MIPEQAPERNPYGAPGPVDLVALSAAITPILEGLEGSKWQGAELTFRCPAPDHEDRRPSASWKPDGGRGDGGLWTCHARHCEASHGGGGALALAALLRIDADAFRTAGALPAPRAAAPERRNGTGPTKGAPKGQRQPATAGAAPAAKRPQTLEALRRNPRNTVFEYQDADGQTVGLAVRVAHDDGGKHFNTWRPDGAGAWLPERIAGNYPPYRLPAILDTAGPVYLAEGEKCADALARVGLPGTSCIMGAGKVKETDLTPLQGRPVVILPDADDAGRAHAQDVAKGLQGIAASVRVLAPFTPPDTFTGKGYDVADWLADGGTAGELEALAKAAPEWTPPPMEASQATASSPAGAAGDRPPPESQAAALVRIGKTAELFTDADGRAFATITKDSRQETHAVKSSTFRRWLAFSYSKEQGNRVPTASTIADALSVLEGEAAYADGAQMLPVHVRYAEHDGRIFVDLGGPDWRAVEVSADGWRVIDLPPVRFRRAKAMGPMPEPERGGSLELLRDFVNLEPDDWPLFLGWLVCAMRPRGPYPVLVLGGEQGSSKSTIMKVARRLVDPNTAPLRAEPKEARDLMISANNGWCLALDNLDRVEPWLSNALCRLATGGGFSVRTNYADDEETIFQATRPVALNGIGDVATRPDLLDRSLMLAPPTIPEHKRRSEADFWDCFELQAGRIFGALLDALSTAIQRLPDTHLPHLPRMADAALWVAAAEPGLGQAPGAFVRAMEANKDKAVGLALEASPVAAALIAYLTEFGSYEGTTGALLLSLGTRVDRLERPTGWPKSATQLSNALRRIAPALRDKGVTREFVTDTAAGKVYRFKMDAPPKKGGGTEAQEAQEAQPNHSKGSERASVVPPVPPERHNRGTEAQERHGNNPGTARVVPVVPLVPLFPPEVMWVGAQVNAEPAPTLQPGEF